MPAVGAILTVAVLVALAAIAQLWTQRMRRGVISGVLRAVVVGEVMRPPGWFRLMRAAVFAVVCVVLSLAGHDLMASRPAPVWAGWAALAGVTAVGYCLADRRRPAWWIMLAVEVAQLCLHEWFAWITPAGSGPAAQDMAMTMHGGMHTVAIPGMAMPMGHGSGVSELGMLGMHALAGALAALWLHVGERAAWRVLEVLGEAVLGRALRVFVLLAYARWAATRRPVDTRHWPVEDDAPPPVTVLRHVVVRRGPPRHTGAVRGACM